MKAMVVQEERLVMKEVDQPNPKQGELLIKVKAAAVNRTDILNRKNKTTYMDMPILGVEVAGIVEQAGEHATIKKGTHVMGLVNGGGYAEYVTMPEARAMIIPAQLSFEEAAAIPEVFLTAYQTLFWLGKLNKEETVLIHAGGSGVGTAAIQLAKQLRSANVITTAGSAEKLVVCQSLGAHTIINYKKQDFSEVVSEITENQGVHVVLDFVGASYWDKNYQSIAIDGRWILIGILGGSKIKELNMMDLMMKRIQLIGTLLTPRSDQYKADLTKEFSEHALPLFTSGKLKPVIDQVFPLEKVQQAHEHMEANRNIGKIILAV